MELVTAVRGVSSYLPVCPPTQTISTLSREEHPATSATAKLHFLAAARCTAPSHPCEPAGPRSRRPNTSHLSPRGPAPWRPALGTAVRLFGGWGAIQAAHLRPVASPRVQLKWHLHIGTSGRSKKIAVVWAGVPVGRGAWADLFHTTAA